MVQVLPYVQSPLEQLTPYLAQAAGDIGQGLGMRSRNKADQSILSQLRSGNIAAADYNTLYSKLSPEAKKQEEPFLQSRLRVEEAQKKEDIKAAAAEKKTAMENAEELKGISNTIKSLEEKSSKVSLPQWNPKNASALIPGTDRYQDREQFDREGFLAADKVFSKFNKGTITKEKLEIIKNELAPNSKFSHKTNTARIKALKNILNLPDDTSEQKIDSIIKSSKKGEDKYSKQKDIEIGQSFEKLPAASSYPNAVFNNGSKKYRSNGRNWEEI